MEEYTNIFAALSEKTRLRIMWVMLKSNMELCVCEIIDLLEESQYNVSRHLKMLKNVGLLQTRKNGRWVFYSLKNNLSEFQNLIYQTIMTLPSELFQLEEKKLKAGFIPRQDCRCDDTPNMKRR